ncbi:MAG: AbrB/MazE/SpoVT family DNA-binding domain-containing protein [Oscillospiraceae bacterium]|jgi:antitoxin MazE|nr:AbrB/MazE/SpoVT family DNA-binding domain-containing protein [Oscillospiraceae bacterium]
MIYGSIQRWGNSQGIRLPKGVLAIASLRENDEVEIIATEQAITIRKSKRYKSLDDLFAGYAGDHLPAEFDTGDAVGREVLD